MGLSATLNIAQSALGTNAALANVVSRNIAGVNDPSYSRKLANVETTSGGSSTVDSISRASNAALFNHLLSSTSDSAASQALSDGLDQLEQTVNLTASASASDKTTTTSGTSPADLLGALTSALQTYASAPGDTAAAQAFLISAKAMANGLNQASQTVQSVRQQADNAIASAVQDVNALLTQFQTANTAIMKGKVSGADITDALDARDKVLTSLSSDIGITTTTAADGGMSIYTDSGVTLFQGTPRTVSFTPTSAFADGTVGNAVTVDGVPVTGSSSVMPIASGSIAGLSRLRDTTTVSYQNQLNQIASGLITVFADTDHTGGTAPTIPGLFTYSGAPALPTTGQTGLAANISVSTNVDPAQGGVLARMRDGNVGNPSNAAYNANTTGAASYSTHLTALIGNLGTSQTFSAASGGSASGTLASYAASSVSWLENQRSTATTAASNQSAVATQAATTLSNARGVNLDDQLSQMLDLEHSYQASAHLMSTVNSMYTSLLSAIQ